MKNEINMIEPDLDGKAVSIGMVMSRFNAEIVQALRDACIDELQRLGVQLSEVTLVTVPGALEIPLALKTFAESEAFDALIALGAVVRGETYHFEVVANESARGIMQMTLDYDIPIANAVLTTENEAQAWARVEEKGRDAAKVAVEMANLWVREEGI